MRAGAVVLAAGQSRRMGRNKLLLPVGGATVLDSLLSSLREVIDDVVVVTGHDPEPITMIAARYGCRVIHNPIYDRGMTTSFQAGLRTLDADAAFLVLGDQLCLNQDTLRKMMATMEGDLSVLIVSPAYKGKRGHPTLIRRALFGEFLALGDDGIMRDVVRSHESAHRTVEGDEWCTTDMDTPADYKDALKKLRSYIRSQRRSSAWGS